MSRKCFKRDLTQEHAILLFDQLTLSVIDRLDLKWLNQVSSWFKKNPKPVKGMYLWGGVGRGKTFLMDLFYDTLPYKKKHRVHFHHFMKDIHYRLSLIKHEKNPLQIISKQLSQEYTVLCLDEFLVQDIGDAMILSELFAALFEQGITLVTTSNTAPENLYLDGLQRSQFLRTIDLISINCEVIHVDSGSDYRTSDVDLSEEAHSAIPVISPIDIQYLLKTLDHELLEKNTTIEIQSRFIDCVALYNDAVWFDFNQICKTYRSRNDYIEIAHRYKTVVVSGIFTMDDQANDITRRFITLVDVLYDEKTNLMISSDVDLDVLYKGEFLKFEFARTLSRLIQMHAGY
ncbi:MAG: AFG1 family ATPase [Gammaproteobacteria bacterium]|nr:AFG1 family ATPase [Gammaproteobacteria bacterium]